MKILRSLNPYEEAEIKEIQEKQRKLHLIPTPVCYVDIDVLDKNGEVVSKYSDRSKSWVRNFYNYCTCTQFGLSAGILGSSFGAGYLAPKDTTGSVRGGSGAIYNSNAMNNQIDVWCRGSAGNTSRGIVIGTSDSAESFESYVMGTTIAEGTGTGQMAYQAMAATNPVWDGTGKTMTQTLDRYIINNSGATITVKEVGLIALFWVSSTSYPFLISRDLLSPAVDVANSGQIKITYTVQITYP